jgi:hypothetical protein
VFIGQDMDKEELSRELDECLLTELEIAGMDAGTHFVDDWPM